MLEKERLEAEEKMKKAQAETERLHKEREALEAENERIRKELQAKQLAEIKKKAEEAGEVDRLYQLSQKAKRSNKSKQLQNSVFVTAKKHEQNKRREKERTSQSAPTGLFDLGDTEAPTSLESPPPPLNNVNNSSDEG